MRAIEALHILQEEMRRWILRGFEQRQEVQEARRSRVLLVHPISNPAEWLAWWAAANAPNTRSEEVGSGNRESTGVKEEDCVSR